MILDIAFDQNEFENIRILDISNKPILCIPNPMYVLNDLPASFHKNQK